MRGQRTWAQPPEDGRPRHHEHQHLPLERRRDGSPELMLAVLVLAGGLFLTVFVLLAVTR